LQPTHNAWPRKSCSKLSIQAEHKQDDLDEMLLLLSSMLLSSSSTDILLKPAKAQGLTMVRTMIL
jgi:hypothetical protein